MITMKSIRLYVHLTDRRQVMEPYGSVLGGYMHFLRYTRQTSYVDTTVEPLRRDDSYRAGDRPSYNRGVDRRVPKGVRLRCL